MQVEVCLFVFLFGAMNNNDERMQLLPLSLAYNTNEFAVNNNIIYTMC